MVLFFARLNLCSQLFLHRQKKDRRRVSFHTTMFTTSTCMEHFIPQQKTTTCLVGDGTTRAAAPDLARILGPVCGLCSLQKNDATVALGRCNTGCFVSCRSVALRACSTRPPGLGERKRRGAEDHLLVQNTISFCVWCQCRLEDQWHSCHEPLWRRCDANRLSLARRGREKERERFGELGLERQDLQTLDK